MPPGTNCVCCPSETSQSCSKHNVHGVADPANVRPLHIRPALGRSRSYLLPSNTLKPLRVCVECITMMHETTVSCRQRVCRAHRLHSLEDVLSWQPPALVNFEQQSSSTVEPRLAAGMSSSYPVSFPFSDRAAKTCGPAGHC